MPVDKIAPKIINMFSDIRMNHHDISALAWWTAYLAPVTVVARIILFCDKFLEYAAKNKEDLNDEV